MIFEIMLFQLAHWRYLGIVKTKGILRTKVYFPKLDELVEKLLAKCLACKVVRKKHQYPTLIIIHEHKKIMGTVNIDFFRTMTDFINSQFCNSSILIDYQRFTKYGFWANLELNFYFIRSGTEYVSHVGHHGMIGRRRKIF